MEGRLGNYVRTHRKRAGLSQRELGLVLGYDNEAAVSRHERLRSLPPLLIALGYEAIFRVPVSEMFAGLHEVVEQAIEGRLAELERNLQHRSRRRAAGEHALKWLSERRGSQISSVR